MTVRLTDEDRIEGYVIMNPAFPAFAGYHTFGRTMGEAWERFSPSHHHDGFETAAFRGRCAAKGIRPIPATLVIDRAAALSPEAPASSKEEDDGR